MNPARPCVLASPYRGIAQRSELALCATGLAASHPNRISPLRSKPLVTFTVVLHAMKPVLAIHTELANRWQSLPEFTSFSGFTHVQYRDSVGHFC